MPLQKAKSEDSSALYKEMILLGGYSDSEGWVNKRHMLKNAIGGEYFRKFSGAQGDYLTLDLQVRLTYDFSEAFRDAWDIEFHNAWVEYKLGFGKNIRFGHFDPSFGLEPVLDTHGKLLQTLAGKNIGFKKDWGLGFRGYIGAYDYEVSLQLGSGMDLDRRDRSLLFTQRVGKPQGSNFIYGLSLLYGRIIQSMDMQNHSPDMDMPAEEDTILKKRIGLDAQYTLRSFLIKGEVAFGQDAKKNVLGTFLEVDYNLPFLQALAFQFQGQSWHRDLNNSDLRTISLSVGASYNLTSGFTIRMAYFHDIDLDKQFFLQLHYYGA
jgi:hypothetical protein